MNGRHTIINKVFNMCFIPFIGAKVEINKELININTYYPLC